MYYTGFADEAADCLEKQIAATKELGWKYIETRALSGKNLASLNDTEFERVQQLLSESGVSFNCYGSAIANWAKPLTESPDSSYEEMRNAVPRMQKLGIKMVRIMSFSVPENLKAEAWTLEDEVIRRVSNIVKMAEDAGIVCVHENCMNWGGLSWKHTLRLCERIQSPSFRLVFDTGNPVFNTDYSGTAPYEQKQSSWEFYRNIRDFIAYIHIKDGKVNSDGKMVFSFAGEGDGDVKRILTDLFRRGYDGGISIEPHMGHVFHETEQDEGKRAAFRYSNYIEYGRKLDTLIAGIKAELAKE